MTELTEWADARLDRVVRHSTATVVVDQTFAATDGSDARGRLRILHADTTIVDSRLTMPSAGIDSVMLHAFAPSTSTAPHLLSDLAVLPDGRWHFHVDLAPRVDLVMFTDYLDTVYPPLTATVDAAYAIEGSVPIPIPRRLRALASPWLIGVVASPADEPAMTAAHDSFADRWSELLTSPPQVDGMGAADLAARDAHHRAAVFDDATDPVWGFVASIIGRDAADTLLDAVRAVR